MIAVKAQENANSMLRSQAKPLGRSGDAEYFILDGKAWSIIGGVVYRHDDQDETKRIVDAMKGRQPITYKFRVAYLSRVDDREHTWDCLATDHKDARLQWCAAFLNGNKILSIYLAKQ